MRLKEKIHVNLLSHVLATQDPINVIDFVTILIMSLPTWC